MVWGCQERWEALFEQTHGLSRSTGSAEGRREPALSGKTWGLGIVRTWGLVSVAVVLAGAGSRHGWRTFPRRMPTAT